MAFPLAFQVRTKLWRESVKQDRRGISRKRDATVGFVSLFDNCIG